MGYTMRYITTDEREITLVMIEAALRQIDTAYAITNTDVPTIGDLMHGDTRLGIVEINRPGDDIFDDDLAEFQDMVGAGDTLEQQRVRDVLHSAQTMVAVEAFWPGTDAEPVLAKLDVLWDWLFAHYPGLLQADSEGFYDGDTLILERRFML
ncbi:MAG: hypothetical protein HZC41_13235 [Chloroflexi bacterium]|nr:hypothetical protein [Chloroflexota bacterium]